MNDPPEFGERHRILWRTGDGGRIGEVRNYATNRKVFRTVPVLLDDDLMERVRMRFLVASWAGRGPEIIVSEAFRALPQGYREAGIWHEIGHIHHEHHLDTEFSDQAHLRAARIAAIKQGQVLPMEAEADRFAVARIGKVSLIGFLTHLLQTRPTGGALGWNDLGKRELEIRIEAIQAL